MVGNFIRALYLQKIGDGDTPSVTAPHKDHIKDGSLVQILLQKSLHV